MNFALRDLEQLKQRLENIESFPKRLEELSPFFKASEYQLIQLMVENNVWQPPVPPPPLVPPGVNGKIECALFAYWLNNPPQVIQNFLNAGHPLIKLLWQTVAKRIPTQIDDTNHQALLACAKAGGLLAPNGALCGDRQYEQVDLRWIWAWVNYLVSHHVLHPAPFVTTPASPILLTGSIPNQIKIVLVGDWGTGDSTASSVMARIVDLQPDYIVHLGDVYYAGTGGDYLPLHEEQSNLLGFWPANYAGRSFTLNSNHEMYSGGEGYFKALSAPNSPFSAQHGASYFSLQYGGWTILGLDSAYYSTSPMIMDGSIGGLTGIQAQWIQAMKLSPSKVIVLTHHNALSDDGSLKQALWGEISAALNGDPFAWYWGHEHLGIVYKRPTLANPPSNTFGRCLGHGALPYGDASELHGAPAVEWYSHSPQPASKLVYNGFALLTLASANDQMTMITEEFFDLGSATNTWKKVIYP